MFLKSKLGIFLAASYIVLSIAAVIFAFACQSAGCGFIYLIIMMPWGEMLNIPLFNNFFIAYFVAVTLNAIIIYFFAIFIDWIRKSTRMKRRRIQ